MMIGSVDTYEKNMEGGKPVTIMSAVRKWAEGKNSLIVLFAVSATTAAQSCYEIYHIARDNELLRKLGKIPSLDKWEMYYSQPQNCISDLISAMRFDEESGGIMEAGLSLPFCDLKELKESIASLSPEEWKDQLEKGKAIGEYLLELAFAADQLELPFPVDIKKHLINSPAMLFFFCVWAPCWLAYGESVHAQYQKAINGDPEALENLIKLDRFILEIPAIRQKYYELSQLTNENLGNSVDRTFARVKLPALELLRVKVIISALILKISRAIDDSLDALPQYSFLKINLKIPDIQRLYDAIAKDQKGHLRDIDLHDDEDTFARSVRRELKFWPDMPSGQI